MAKNTKVSTVTTTQLAQLQTQNVSQGTPAFATGKVVSDATTITTTDYLEVVCGFKPKYVAFIDATNRIKGEFYEGMADDSCIKTAANGTVTLEVTGGNGGITLIQNGFRVLQNATLALVVASATCYWQARA